jgi:hypothetical protein
VICNIEFLCEILRVNMESELVGILLSSDGQCFVLCAKVIVNVLNVIFMVV